MKMAVSHQPRLLLEDVSKGSVALLLSSIPHVLKAAAVPAECPLDNLMLAYVIGQIATTSWLCAPAAREMA